MIKKVAIFCGGPSSEHEVSLDSAKTIYNYIDMEKYELYFFFISKEKKCKLFPASNNVNLSKTKASTELSDGLEDIKEKNIFAFLAGIHGEFVEDGHLQSLLEFYEIPFSGTDSRGSALCMDKYHSMFLVDKMDGVNIPRTVHFNDSFDEALKIQFPAFLKPNSLGSSVGISKITHKKELTTAVRKIQKLGQHEMLLQEFIEGIEISCGVLQDKKGKITLLPPIEIQPNKSETFDYASKYEAGGSTEITPPVSLSKSLSRKISEITAEIHILLGCKTYSRSDFRIKNGSIYYLETNTLPGMTATSLLPQEAAANGINFPKLLDFIIDNSYV